MAVEYDLVILGGAVEGRVAAARAVKLGARVALIEPPGLFVSQQQQKYLLSVIQAVGRHHSGQRVNEYFSSAVSGAALQDSLGRSPEALSLDWSTLLAWSEAAAKTQSPHLSWEVLMAHGVDVILEQPLQLTERIWVRTATRNLRSRAVLAAFGRSPAALQPLLAANRLPASVHIFGGSARAIAWASALSLVGVPVSVLAKEILPGWDSAIQQNVRSHLGALGIQWVSAQVATDLPPAALTLRLQNEQSAMVLPAFIKYSSQQSQIAVNETLQANVPRLFACGFAGDCLGRTATEAVADGESIARHGAMVAVDNALFWPRTKVRYASVPQGYGAFAQAGLTQHTAQQRYDSVVRVQAAGCANSDDLAHEVPWPSYCKLLHVRQKLVGIHLFGDSADTAIQLMAPLLGEPIRNLSQAIAGETYPSGLGGVMNAIAAALAQAQPRQWRPGQWRRDWAENWFNWRRSRKR